MRNLSLNRYFKVAILALVLSSMAACAAKKNPMRDAIAAAKKAKAAKESAARMDKDVSSAGGQPTRIELYGAIADQKLTDNKQVTVEAIPGVGWQKTTPDLDPANAPALSAAIPESHQDAVNSIVSKDYINLGCDQKVVDSVIVPGTLSVKIAKPKTFAGVRLLQADTILVCGTDSLVGSEITILKSTNLYLFSSKNIITQGAKHARSLVVWVRDLYLNGDNSIGAIVPSGPVTPTSAGILSLTVIGSVKGEGTLDIKSVGSSYFDDGSSSKHHKHGHGGSGGHHHQPQTPPAAQPTPAPTPDQQQPTPAPSPTPDSEILPPNSALGSGF